MSSLENISLKIKNYKCFGETEYGYDKIMPINLIIGRNNTGKSTLLELVDYVTHPKSLNHLGHKGQVPQVILSDFLTKEELSQVFKVNTSGGPIREINHWVFGSRWVGKPITWELQQNKFDFISIDPPLGIEYSYEFETTLANIKANPFSKFTFKRLLADRDIFPEVDSNRIELIEPNGRGATNAIQRYINQSDRPRELVENDLLKELNDIFEPDGRFTRILVQRLANEQWEIYLEEANKGRIPLSHTGSGLKTILLVLVLINLVPHIEGKPLSDYLFGLEELENNLHPALQRRLLMYLRKKAVEQGCHFFLTTHSNVAIDLFASDNEAQIIHVNHDGKCAYTKRITTYVDNKGILDDLDVRASDLLQANGIVWVEGPSDRLYFNKWMEVWSEGRIKEGAHYQCVFYGGRLLAHLSVDDPDIDPDDAVKILKVNRNAILLLDSDKRNEDDGINSTKQRILNEVEKFGAMGWLTTGKEVENYIPHEAIVKYYDDDNLELIEKFQDFAEYLDNIKSNEGNRFKRGKVIFAERFCKYITKENMKDTLDLATQVEVAYQSIVKWNNIRQ